MQDIAACADAKPFQLESRPVLITHRVLVAQAHIAIALAPLRTSRPSALVQPAGIENARCVTWSKPFSWRGARSEKTVCTSYEVASAVSSCCPDASASSDAASTEAKLSEGWKLWPRTIVMSMKSR